eukprot:335880-Alexandrium_andersonii.AAC.1
MRTATYRLSQSRPTDSVPGIGCTARSVLPREEQPTLQNPTRTGAPNSVSQFADVGIAGCK